MFLKDDTVGAERMSSGRLTSDRTSHSGEWRCCFFQIMNF